MTSRFEYTYGDPQWGQTPGTKDEISFSCHHCKKPYTVALLCNCQHQEYGRHKEQSEKSKGHFWGSGWYR